MNQMNPRQPEPDQVPQDGYPDVQQERTQQEIDDLSERLTGFVGKLEGIAKERVQRRNPTEQRWIDDLMMYHGKYSEDLLKRMAETKGSKIFINHTRTKTNAMMARLWDLLFPTDDRNWGISPSPVPEMTEDAQEAAQIAMDADDTMKDADNRLKEATELGDAEMQQKAAEEKSAAEGIKNEARRAAEELHKILNEAKRRSQLMQDEIDDQLKTCAFQSECRDMIEDGCKLGTGILKGPVIGERTKTRYKKVMTSDENGQQVEAYELVHEPNDLPAAHRVDPWSFFPDPDARSPEDSEGFFERHLLNPSQMRKLQRRDDIDKDVLRKLLRAGTKKGQLPSYLVDLNNVTGDDTNQNRELFQVWEYTGPVDHEDMELLIEALSRDDLETQADEMDPLVEFHAKIWFCDGEVLSFELHPLDSKEPIYSVFNLERDEAGMFGFGIPYIMRNPQIIVNASTRMMMDNAGLGTGPQIVVNKDVVTPEDGNYTLTPRKVWLRNNTQLAPNVPAFETYKIDMHQNELAAIIELARRDIDDVTSMPAIAQGEQGTGITKTAQGMALLMNSANVVFRRIVKNYDDDVTVPIIRRMFQWNMQFNKKSHIKGDFDIVARGSSVLLVREMQAQNLLMIAQMFGDHPVYGPRLKHGDLLAQIFKAHMIPADEITKTDTEIEEDARKAQEKGDPQAAALQADMELKKADLELRRQDMELRSQIANMEWDKRLQIAQLNFDAAMTKTAEALNMKRDELDAKIETATMTAQDRRTAAQITADAKERGLAAEIAIKQQTGDSSGGAI